MKKVILLFSLMNLFYAGEPRAAVIVDGDPIVESQKQDNSGPKSVHPSVSFSAQGDELTIDINRYLGNAQVTVVAEDGSSTTCNTYYINGHTSCVIDFTGYNEGHYSITITLQGGQAFSGGFSIE